MNELINRWIDGCLGGWTDYECLDEWMDGQMDRWIDGWVNDSIE